MESQVQVKTLMQAGITAHRKKLIFLHCLNSSITRLVDIYNVFARCVEKSHLKPEEEIWGHGQSLESSIGGPVRNLAFSLKTELYCALVAGKRGIYEITPSGKVYLNSLKPCLEDNYLAIISEYESEESFLSKLYTQSTLEEKVNTTKAKYFDDNGVLKDEFRKHLANVKYIAHVKQDENRREFLFIGIWGDKTALSDEIQNREDITIETMDPITSCCDKFFV